MGLFSKSILILMLAISGPLLYRHFANDDTIKFMSGYYSNFKVIDQFLRQSAGHLDRAKDYLPDRQQVDDALDKVRTHVDALISTAKDKLDHYRNSGAEQQQAKSDKSVGGKPKKSSDSYKLSSCPSETIQVRLWSKEDLAKFDGNSGDEIYLGYLGLVYNVTKNLKHYKPGSEYSAFAGRDATRAFVTGNFTHDLYDDISDIEESFFVHVEQWASYYNTTYQVLGRIVGAFFDSRGCGTRELGRVFEIFKKLATERARQASENKLLPECNSEWNGDLHNGRVWCSTQSGGVERDWEGVPRKLKDSSDRCVCVNLDAHHPSEHSRFGVYPGCEPTASECPLK